MKLYYLPLILMLCCGIFYQLYANSSAVHFEDNVSVEGDTWEVSQDLNETTTSITTEFAGFQISLDLDTGILMILVSFIVLAIAVGINVVGSGMNDFGASVIYKTLVMYGLWAVVSLLSAGMFALIPILGWLLYFIITCVYGLGAMEVITAQ